MLRWLFGLLLLALLIGLQVKLWHGEGNLHQVSKLRVAIKQQKVDNAQLTLRNQALAADVDNLKHGDQAVEMRARSELGLIKPGEVFYQVVGPAPTSTASPAHGH